jgi:hypothetical protein
MAKMLFIPVPRIRKDFIIEVENGKLCLLELQHISIILAKLSSREYF